MKLKLFEDYLEGLKEKQKGAAFYPGFERPLWGPHEFISNSSTCPHFGNLWTNLAIPVSFNILQEMLVKALILKLEESWCEYLEKPPLWNVCMKLAFWRKILQQVPRWDWVNFPVSPLTSTLPLSPIPSSLPPVSFSPASPSSSSSLLISHVHRTSHLRESVSDH